MFPLSFLVLAKSYLLKVWSFTSILQLSCITTAFTSEFQLSFPVLLWNMWLLSKCSSKAGVIVSWHDEVLLQSFWNPCVWGTGISIRSVMKHRLNIIKQYFINAAWVCHNMSAWVKFFLIQICMPYHCY